VVRRLLSPSVVRTSSSSQRGVKSLACTNTRTQHTASFIDTKATPAATGSTHLSLHLHLNTARTTSTHAIAQHARRIAKTSRGKQIDINLSVRKYFHIRLSAPALYKNELNRQHTDNISRLQGQTRGCSQEVVGRENRARLF
jgi:hypothetical protein